MNLMRSLIYLIILVLNLYQYRCIISLNVPSYHDKLFNINLTKLMKKNANTPNQLSHLQIKSLIVNSINSIDEKKNIDTKTFTMAIQCCNEQEEFSTALEIFHLMNKTNSIPDRVTYGVAMTACMHLGNEYEANHLFQRCNKKFKLGSSKKYFKEDHTIFSLMIATFDATGSWIELLNIYDHINSIYGMKPSINMINSALRATKRLQQWDKYDDIVSSLAILNNTIPYKSKKIMNSKSLSDCLTSLNEINSADDISLAIAQVSAENPDNDHVINKLISRLDAILKHDTSAMKFIMNDSKLRRRIERLLAKLLEGPIEENDELIKPTIDVYSTLIRGSGLRNNSELAFELFNNAFATFNDNSNNFSSISSIDNSIDNSNVSATSYDSIKKRGLYRSLVEACVQANDQMLLLKARLLIEHEYGTLKSKHKGDDTDPLTTTTTTTTSSSLAYGIIPTAQIVFNGKEYSLNNNLGEFSTTTKNLINVLLKSNSKFYNKINIKALPEQGMNIPITHGKEILSLHCEKQALSGLLQLNTCAKTPLADYVLDVNVNLCMCNDCHSFFKAISHKLQLEIKCKDPSRTHIFHTDGSCSCRDHWGGR